MQALQKLTVRQPADLVPAAKPPLTSVGAISPSLVLRAFGEGPELAALQTIGRAAGVTVETHDTASLSLGRRQPVARPQIDGRPPFCCFTITNGNCPCWKRRLREAASISARRAANMRERLVFLACWRAAWPNRDIARVRSPIGLLPACRSAANAGRCRHWLR